MFAVGVKAKLIKVNPLADFQMPPKVKAHIPTPKAAEAEEDTEDGS